MWASTLVNYPFITYVDVTKKSDRWFYGTVAPFREYWLAILGRQQLARHSSWLWGTRAACEAFKLLVRHSSCLRESSCYRMPPKLLTGSDNMVAKCTETMWEFQVEWPLRSWQIWTIRGRHTTPSETCPCKYYSTYVCIPTCVLVNHIVSISLLTDKNVWQIRLCTIFLK